MDGASGVLVGFGFLTKMLQAFIVLPAFGLVYLLAAPTSFWRRAWHVIVLGVTTIAACAWWVAIVELWPAGSRPTSAGRSTAACSSWCSGTTDSAA